MDKQGLYFSMPARPFHGYNVADLIEGLREIQSSAWSEVGKLRRKVAAAHPCSLNQFFGPIIDQVENDLKNCCSTISGSDRDSLCMYTASRRLQDVIFNTIHGRNGVMHEGPVTDLVGKLCPFAYDMVVPIYAQPSLEVRHSIVREVRCGVLGQV